MPVLPVLVEMEQGGMCVSKEWIEDMTEVGNKQTYIHK